MSKTRLEFFSDGVFAIICTILVVGFQIPSLHDTSSSAAMLRSLLEMAPSFGSYFLSFALVTRYWIAHHELIGLVRTINAPLIWANNLFLMWLALLPFPTELMGHYPHDEIAVIFFGGVTFLAAAAFLCLRLYLLLTRDLAETAFDRARLTKSIRASAVGIALYLTALIVSYLSDGITLTMYGLVPFLFLMPLRLPSLRRSGMPAR
jgi:uncharacterized membrane protein